MGSFNFIPLPNAVPTAAKTSSGAALETKGSLAAKSNDTPFQTLLTQAGEKLNTQKSENTVKFSDLPEELQQLIQEKFGVAKDGEIQLLELPAEAVRVDENGELRISLDQLDGLLQEGAEANSNSNFHFLDIKNADQQAVDEEGNIITTDDDETSHALFKSGAAGLHAKPDEAGEVENTDSKVKHLVQSIVQDHSNEDGVGERQAVQTQNENDSIANQNGHTGQSQVESNNADSTLRDAIQVLQQRGAGNSTESNPGNEAQSKAAEAGVSELNIQAKINGKETGKETGLEPRVSELAKQNVISLNGSSDGEDDAASVNKTVKDASGKTIDEKSLSFRAGGADGLDANAVKQTGSLASKLDQTLEVTGELAKEIAKLNQANQANQAKQSNSAESPEYVIVKSPVQSKGESDVPVLFLINAKDIQAESNTSQKLTLLKSEMVNGEKSQTVDGQIKINFTPSEQSGEENGGDAKGDAKDGNSSKNSKSNKLPELTQSAFQISKSLNEQSEAKRADVNSNVFQAQVKASVDQTALEAKTAAQPTAGSSDVVSTSGTSNTTQTTATTGQEISSATSTQQSNGTQGTAKAAAPPEIPQAYKDAATQQIVRGVQSSIGSERSHVSIQLHPESLGKVDIQLKMQNGMMTAHIVAEKESTHAMLEKNAATLKTALEDKNIQVDKVQIGRDTQENRQSNQEQNRSNERWREYLNDRNSDQNRERREQNEQQQHQQQNESSEEQKPWQTLSRYMDRFFQRTQA